MNDTALASSRRLGELRRREHACLADLLVALAAFDRQGFFRDLGFHRAASIALIGRPRNRIEPRTPSYSGTGAPST
jgi:hypothetical protein